MNPRLLRAILPVSMSGLAACSSAGSHTSPIGSASSTSVAPPAPSRNPSADRAVQVAEADIRNALTAELTVFTDNQRFSQASDLSTVLPDVPLANYPTAPSPLVQGTVYVAVLNPTVVELSAVAATKLYTIVEDSTDPNSGTHYAVTSPSAGRPPPGQVTALSW